MDTQRAYIDFLHAIEGQASVFISTYELLIDAASATINYEIQLFVVIEKFRHHMRLKKARKKKAFVFNSTFVADESNKSNESNKSKFDRNTSFREENQSISTCVCDEKHWLSLCLHFEKDKRFIDWKSDANIQKKVNEALKDSHKKE